MTSRMEVRRLGGARDLVGVSRWTYGRRMATSEPDALEKIRAARGEGWDWTRIQAEPCPQCGYEPAAMDPASLGDVAVETAGRWREFLVSADEGYLRHIPEPGVNSPLQYAAHVRDILRVYGDRMTLGLEQDRPTVPIFNPAQEVWEEYNRSDPAELADDIDARAQAFAATVGDLAAGDPSRWSREVVNDRGPYGVYTFTIVGLARNVVHEAHHHLLDATGTLPSATA